jgi:hypothetical protein
MGGTAIKLYAYYYKFQLNIFILANKLKVQNFDFLLQSGAIVRVRTALEYQQRPGVRSSSRLSLHYYYRELSLARGSDSLYSYPV